MANQSNGWGAGDVSFFAPFYEKITSDYCMDTSRIFAAGESSGGDFVGILGCEHADKLRSVAPCATKHVNGYDLDASVRQCTGQVTAVVIHGQNDNVVGTSNGPKMRDFYKQLNHCQDSTTPVESYTDTLSNCVKFEGCDPGYDTYWCNHTDPEYNGTNHGWPKFAAKMLVETWAEL
jgi:poly(3-hydroxybutyrate) depolymerase